MASWTLRSETRNPLDVLIEREERERSCKGCIHLGSFWSVAWCMKKEAPAKRKCAKDFKEAN